MARKPRQSPIVCEYFAWRLFRRDGVYYADGRTTKNNLGKHSLGTKDRTQALENLRKLDRQVALQRGLVSLEKVLPGTAPSVSAGWELFMQHCARPGIMGGVSVGTIKRYRAVRDKHQSYCAKKGLESFLHVTTPTVEDYGRWLTTKGCAARTIYLELTLIKSVVLWLIGTKRLPPTSQLAIELQKAQGTDTYCFGQQQVVDMVGFCREHTRLRWLWPVLATLACTGFRIGELASLRWTDIDLVARTIQLTDERASARRKNVRRTKSGRNRTLPIHPALYEILIGMERHPDGRVFHGPRGGALKPDTVRLIFVREVIAKLIAKYPTPPGEIGFEHGTPHSFRHYFCSRAFADGASAEYIREWLGHHDSKMVEHYRHLGDEDSQRKMQQIHFLGDGDRAGGIAGAE